MLSISIRPLFSGCDNSRQPSGGIAPMSCPVLASRSWQVQTKVVRRASRLGSSMHDQPRCFAGGNVGTVRGSPGWICEIVKVAALLAFGRRDSDGASRRWRRPTIVVHRGSTARPSFTCTLCSDAAMSAVSRCGLVPEDKRKSDLAASHPAAALESELNHLCWCSTNVLFPSFGPGHK